MDPFEHEPNDPRSKQDHPDLENEREEVQHSTLRLLFKSPHSPKRNWSATRTPVQTQETGHNFLTG
jgi:hypothetical protein